MKKLGYKDVLYRIAYFRNKTNLSARETSLRMGCNESYINRVEREVVDLKVKALLEFMDLVEISPQEFFYPNPDNFEKDKEIFDLISTLSSENKARIIDLIKNLK